VCTHTTIKPFLGSEIGMSFDESRYLEGLSKADEWAASGGRLDRDPPVSDEAFENGYADRLNELRQKSRPETKD